MFSKFLYKAQQWNVFTGSESSVSKKCFFLYTINTELTNIN